MRRITLIIIFGSFLSSCTENETPEKLNKEEQTSNTFEFYEKYLDVVQIPPQRPIANPKFAKMMATFTPIEVVSGNYITKTNFIDFSEATCGAFIESVTDGVLNLSFPSLTLIKLQAVPYNQYDFCFWNSPWGRPPAVEDSYPHILYTLGQNSIPISLSEPVNTFGFELQPYYIPLRIPAPIPISIEFYRNGYLIGSISKTFPNENPAKLFAAKTAASFDYVLIIMSEGYGNGFSIGQFRYTLADETLPFTIDIKPESCKNPVNVNSNGVIPVNLLASSEFDVNDIDLSTIRMNGVAPQKSSIADMGGFYEKEDACHCDSIGLDGIKDLDLKFSTQEIFASLGEVSDGEKVTVSLSFETIDGKSWTGEDCIQIIKKGNKR